jgi:hypothetical protein
MKKTTKNPKANDPKAKERFVASGEGLIITPPKKKTTKK